MAVSAAFIDAFDARADGCGALSFRDFMELALYDGRVGYYGSGRATLGRGGDFYTSVSVGSCFGGLLALQAVEVWQALGKPDTFRIVEQGGHDGLLARDVLEAIHHEEPELARRVDYTVCDLRPRQAPAVDADSFRAPPAARLSHVRDLADVGQGAASLFLCNELLDAFPVHRVRFRADGWKELWVVRDGETLRFEERALTVTLATALRQRLPEGVEFADGYTTEVCLQSESWIGSAAAVLGQGMLLVVDYGFVARDYYAPCRTDGTLRCYTGHRAINDVLAAPGEQDVTAHVDWSALRRAGERAGLRHAGFADQGAYLTRLAAPMLRASESGLRRQSPDRKWIRQFQTLTHPGLMGRAFGVMAFSRGLASATWRGFAESGCAGLEL